MIRRCLLGILALGLGVGCKDPALKPARSASEARKSTLTHRPDVGPSWGEGVEPGPAALRALELGRRSEALPSGADARTAWTIARIGGRPAADALAAWLEGDSGATSGHFAALALLDPPPGEPGSEGRWAELEDAIWTRLALTEAPDEVEALLLAIARLGGARSQQRLSVILDSGASVPALETAGMLCARDHAATAEELDMIAGHLGSGGPLSVAATYAVSRCAGPSAELLAGPARKTLVEQLTPALASEQRAGAAMAWKALAALGEVPEDVSAQILGASPPHWMVEVEAARALAGHADGRSQLAERLGAVQPDAFEGPRMHVLLVALRGLRDAVVGTPELLRELSTLRQSLKAARDAASGRRRKAMAMALCEAELLAAIGSGDMAALRSCTAGVDELPDGYAEVLEIEALLRVGAAMTREDKAEQLLARTKDARSTVAAAALAALVDVDDPAVGPTLAGGLGRADVGVRAAAAAALATRASDRARRDEHAVSMLQRAATTWPNATMVEARVAAIEALGNLARSAGEGEAAPWLRASVLPLAKDPAEAVRRAARGALLHDADLVAELERAVAQPRPQPFDEALQDRLARYGDVSGLEITTSAGAITIAFEGPAPFNQATVASLADEGFYDGLSLHRVVPGFVVQGGDPRGDGYGGPGFLVPCEWSNRKFERGVVGMALAGKDTGGSQFFIAQAREPRLDARYTILGRVTKGLDVLDLLLPHDEMLKVEIVRDAG